MLPRGGARPGSGPKRKALTEKISAGKAATVIDLPAADLEGVDMPPVKEYMKARQKNGEALCAEEIFRETWTWLKKVGCTELVNIQLINQYAMRIEFDLTGTDYPRYFRYPQSQRLPAV